jgi:hypothetical protein
MACESVFNDRQKVVDMWKEQGLCVVKYLRGIIKRSFLAPYLITS